MPINPEILVQKARAHKETAYQQFIKNIREPQFIAQSLRVRGSIDGPEITLENYAAVLDALDSQNFSNWNYHDKGRIGSLLQESLQLSEHEKEQLLSYMKPSEVLSIESAYFNSIADMRYIYTGEINDAPLNPYEIRLKLNEEGTKLLYQISDDKSQFVGEIDATGLDLAQITPGFSLYLKENLFEILTKIPPEHIDSKVSDNFFQYLLCGDDMDEELIEKKNEFSNELKLYIGEHVNEMIVNTLLVRLLEIDNTAIEKIDPSWSASERVKFIIKIFPELQQERHSSIEEIRALTGILQAKLEEGFTPELKKRAEALLGKLEGQDLNTFPFSDLRAHCGDLNEFYEDYHTHLETLRQKIEDNFTDLQRILKYLGDWALLIPQFKQLSDLVNDLHQHPDKLMKHYTQIQQQIEALQAQIPMLKQASGAAARFSAFSSGLFSNAQQQLQTVHEKLTRPR